MTAEQATTDSAMLEQLILQVRGVHAVRVVFESASKIDKIHVIGSPARNPKQIVRDIESILYVHGRVRLDHRKVSLVQIVDQPPPVVALRAQIIGVHEERGADELRAVVTLRIGEREVRGVGTSRPSQPVDSLKLTAFATVHALDAIVGPIGRFTLESIQRQPFGSLEIVLVHVSLMVDDRIESLLGTSALPEQPTYAAVRAVLDAVNRRLQRLIQPPI